jgi:hypothetical protein
MFRDRGDSGIESLLWVYFSTNNHCSLFQDLGGEPVMYRGKYFSLPAAIIFNNAAYGSF